MGMKCSGTTLKGVPCQNIVATPGYCGKCTGVAPAKPAYKAEAANAAAADPFAQQFATSTPAAATTPDQARDAATLAVTDYGVVAADEVTSIRKERYEARAELAESLVALEGRKGMTKEEQVQGLRDASRQALAAAMRLEAAAKHAENRDLDGWQAKKMAHGGGAMPSISGDGFVTQEDAKDDAVGWLTDKAADKMAPSDDDFDAFLHGLDSDDDTQD